MKISLAARLATPLALLTLLVPGKAIAHVADSGKAENAIRDVLKQQVEAWNRGDIDNFMNGYARRDDITFVSGDEVHHGWATVLKRYKAHYPDKATMGTLAFSDLQVEVLSADAAIATGRFRLKRAHDTPHGRFTLILRRLPEGWLIVHDHSSSAEKK